MSTEYEDISKRIRDVLDLEGSQLTASDVNSEDVQKFLEEPDVCHSSDCHSVPDLVKEIVARNGQPLVVGMEYLRTDPSKVKLATDLKKEKKEEKNNNEDEIDKTEIKQVKEVKDEGNNKDSTDIVQQHTEITQDNQQTNRQTKTVKTTERNRCLFISETLFFMLLFFVVFNVIEVAIVLLENV
ncbi:hypothetical protein QTN25_009783 [Entamoeba marina]